MKPIEEYLQFNNRLNNVINESVIADLAVRKYHYDQSNNERNFHYIETSTSYLSIRKLIIQLYDSIYINLKRIKANEDNRIKEETERLVSDFVIYSKILIDLFVCLVKTLVSQNPFLENFQYVDVMHNGFTNKTKYPSILNLINQLKRDLKWSEYIRTKRDLLVHRGGVVQIFKMEEEIQINIGKTYLTDVINNLQQSIALKIFRIDEEIDLELIADGIFQMLPELESEIILEVEKILIF